MSDRRKTVKMIRDDALADAKAIDGLEFTGKNVGDAIGKVLAMVHALAAVLDEVLDEMENS